MAGTGNDRALAHALTKVRQYRQYRPDPLSEEDLNALLEIARWTGSSRNTQPWQFIVVTDKERLQQLSQIRTPINWVATAAVAIALVLDGKNQVSESYDEGRVTERLLIGAHLLGLGGGTAWYGDDDQQRQAKTILGIPAELTARSLVALGHIITSTDPRPGAVAGGRKPLSEIVSREEFGKR